MSFLEKFKKKFATRLPDLENPADKEEFKSCSEMVDIFIAAACARDARTYDLNLGDLPEGKTILGLGPDQSVQMVLFCIADMDGYRRKLQKMVSGQSYNYVARMADMPRDRARDVVETLVLRSFLNRKLPFTQENLAVILDWLTNCLRLNRYDLPVAGVVSAAERYLADHEPADGLISRLVALRKYLSEGYLDQSRRRLVSRLDTLLGSNEPVVLNPGDPWADAVTNYLDTLSNPQRQYWSDLLQHCRESTSGKPSQKWLKQANALVDAIGKDTFFEQCQGWLPLVDKPRTQPRKKHSPYDPDHELLMDEINTDLLKGLVWCCGLAENADNARVLVKTAISCYKKIPGIGPRAVRVGNACIAALASMPGRTGLYQLALLQVKLKYGSALKLVKQALEKAAEREGITVIELEEMGVPSYGLDDVGYGEEQVGDYTAIIAIASLGSVDLTWRNPQGKVQKSVPAAVKSDHADDLKELRGTIKDIKSMLSVQKERIEQLYLKSMEWSYGTWAERYLNHPLVGVITRKLIWRFSNDGDTESAIHRDGQWINHRGEPLAPMDDRWTVSLWHPVDEDVDTIKRWRRYIETAEITQPFKQAHREVYLLTDAEINTRVYSNRFASHIIKQHQFNALCGARGWRYTLQGAWDGGSDSIACRSIETFNLWAEFWVHAIGEYGEGTTEVGIFKYLSTDQVRFYAKSTTIDDIDVNNVINNTPTRLENIPPLVLSEIFRDVDLFVGVCSVGNDPEWTDGGADDRFRSYWHSQSFGELSASAETRREILENLLPKLKIGDKCKLVDRFLVVQGTRRVYKIHLGSGNILMEPNNQYLCIVPDSRNKLSGERVFLPFEGDNTLSIILSKATMLAEDNKIKDSTINSQINSVR